jgi:type I restriction enzyme S subunit
MDEGEIALIRSQNVYNNYFQTDGLVYITEQDAAKLSNVEVHERDIIINITGDSVARVCLVPRDVLPARVNQHVAIIRVQEKEFDHRFISYFLTSPSTQEILLSLASAGATRNALTKGMLENLEVPKPDLNVQVKIGDVLSSLDDKIALNRKLNETLEGMARALFQSWFVGFDPVKTKLAAKRHGRDPQHACMAALSGKLRVPPGKPKAECLDDQLPTADELDTAIATLGTLTEFQRQQLSQTAAHFPDGFQDGQSGLVPMGWEGLCIGQILELVYGKALKKTDRKPGPYPVYGSGGVIGNHDSWAVEGPGIIVGRKGTIGSIHWADSPFFPIDTVFYVKPKNGHSLLFIYYLLETMGLSEMNTDAAVPGLNRNNVYRLEIPAYPDSLCAAFSTVADFFRSAVRSNRDQSRTLAELRDTRLPKLLSGELSVNAARNAMGAWAES